MVLDNIIILKIPNIAYDKKPLQFSYEQIR